MGWRSRVSRSLGGVAAVVLTAWALPAQVFQIQGGGSSLFDGYGGLVNIWGNGYEASLGVGYLDGLKLGASARRLLQGRDTLRLGNDQLPFTLDTDVFGPGGNIFAQGASVQRRRGRTQLWTFAGSSATALSAPYFASQRPVHAMAYVRVRHDISRALSVSAHTVVTDRQSALATARWRPSLGMTSAATFGLGTNAPYAAISWEATRPTWEVKASLVGMSSHFRRSSAPMPLQSEMDRDNVLALWKPRDGWSFGVGRQHFRQDSAFRSLPQRATLNQLTVTGRAIGTAFTGGWLVSEAGRTPNISSYVSGRRDVTDRLQAELYLLRVWKPTAARASTPVLIVREAISPRLSLLQTISRNQGRTSVNFGGTVSTGMSSISLDYQVVHSPYLARDPFVQTMGLNARLHLKGGAFSIGSFVTPDGRLHYSAQGSTFVYRGLSSTTGSSAQPGGRLDPYIVHGRVVDDGGAPIEGAAIEVGGEVLYTDSRGRFFVRRPTGRPLVLRVILDDFLQPGRFDVVTAPETVTPSRVNASPPVVIVLRRVESRAN